MDDPAAKAKILAQEEELFQIARLINCGWFGMGILLLMNLYVIDFLPYCSCVL